MSIKFISFGMCMCECVCVSECGSSRWSKNVVICNILRYVKFSKQQRVYSIKVQNNMMSDISEILFSIDQHFLEEKNKVRGIIKNIA